MEKLRVIDDATLTSILRNKAIVTEFPFMQNASAKVTPKKKRGCGSCSGKNRTNTGEFNGIKIAIASMSGERKTRLKELLNTETIRIYYINHKRQKVKVTF